MKTGHAEHLTPKVVGVTSVFIDNSFNAMAFAGMHRAARERGYELLLCYGPPRSALARGLALRRVAGWIAMYTIDGLEDLLADGKPAVIFCAPALGTRCPVVRAENHGSIHRMIEHLTSIGHRRIAYIGKSTSDDFIERSTAFNRAMSARGLATDLNLLSSFGECTIRYTERRFRKLLDRDGKFCTAVVAGNDEMAIGAINAIREAGYRVPEDIAVVGFDDISAAQHCDPPLTTMRQNPELLGRTAVERLIDLLDGIPPPEAVTRVPAELVLRRSCGGGAWQAGPTPPALGALGALGAPGGGGGDWQRDLHRQLNALIEGPALSPLGEPALVWPEAEVVVRGLGAALTGVDAPDLATLERAFDAAITHSDRVEVLLAMLEQIEETAARQLASAPAQDAALRVKAFVGRVRLAQQRAILRWERRGVRGLERLVRANMDISSLLTSKQVWTDEPLEWLRNTSVRLGCIALWANEPGPGGPELVIRNVHSSAADITALVGRRVPADQFPPAELLAAASPEEPSGYLLLVPLANERHDWGTLALGGLHTESFADNLQPLAMWSSLLIAAFERHEMENALHAERDMLAAAYERERALASTVRELGCPVIPLLPGVLLISLIGAIDAARAQQILEAVLSGVAREGARWVLLDVTGVPHVDADTAASLVQTAQATRLLGARVSLVGVGSRMAQGMVDLGIELSGISIFQSLETAVRQLTRSPR
ncbi:LacI family transcriptional regulator [Sorangium cellulosum]|uniref:LacI family transcriptional regulator n=1 Tax=Sorangium cellulosum TaxID=56 RepID=A0A2L0F1B7_SORCE|nr:substrate-binding domain-containing protein [Sorangium cellulosum]AUX45355.1 LacI family transcriptional regulator [Sorangium cellulosum]